MSDVTNDVTNKEKHDHVLFNRIATRYARKDIISSSSLARHYQLLSAIEPGLRSLGVVDIIVEAGCRVGAAFHTGIKDTLMKGVNTIL